MLPNRSYAGDVRRNSAPSRPKKKAPPRPPQPKNISLQNSKSFQHLSSHSGSGETTKSGTGFNTDLIDFSAPPCPPMNILKSGDSGSSQLRESNEGVYRVGASIFYIKSALENSSYSQSGHGNPFSPPRPSAQSLSGTPTKTVHSYEGTDAGRPSYLSNPTIIRSNEFKGHIQNNGRSLPGPENIALAWDEPPAPRAVVMPTIIKPLPPAKPAYTRKPNIRNLYDEPDGFEDNSLPLPATEPPMSIGSVGSSSASTPPCNESRPTSMTDETGDSYNPTASHMGAPFQYYTTESNSDKEQSYAITLYDYASGVDGDLVLQAGDLVYLIKAIDDNWLYGSCGGAEGLFPANYVNVIVPLPPESQQETSIFDETGEEKEEPRQEYRFYSQVQYQFVAESEKELSLEVNETVTVLGRINDDWLFGEKNGERGRFPESFVSPVPLDIPEYRI